MSKKNFMSYGDAESIFGEYAESINEKVTYDDLAKEGVKNIVHLYKSNTSVSNISYAFTDDGGITLSGIASAQSYIFPAASTNASLDSKDLLFENNTEYVLTCKGLVNGVSARVRYNDGSNHNLAVVDSPTTNNSFTTNSTILNASNGYHLMINVADGTDLSTPITIYPMLRNAKIKDDSFSEYAMNNEQLTKKVLEGGGDYMERGIDYVTAGQLVGSTLGTKATAEGQDTVASGSYSHAEGSGTSARSSSSHAEGYRTSAAYNYSHAEGMFTTTSGNGSHAEGYSTLASFNYSHAEGNETTASGVASHAEGYKTMAPADNSHAEGYSTSAANNNSHAEGQYTTARGESSHAEGFRTYVSGNYSHAEGKSTSAFGGNSHAEGYYTCAEGNGAHAEGGYSSTSNNKGTFAIGENSHAEGYYTSAVGNNSHAEGESALAFGKRSHAEGLYTTASGSASHAEGGYTLAEDVDSHAEGLLTTASNFASHAGGHWNAKMTTGGSPNNKTGTAFVIGNGIEHNKLSNAFSVQYDGTVKAASTITASTTADYAEFFEWEDENSNSEDRVGYFVTFSNSNKIRIANSDDDYILGVVSGEPFVLGNGDCDVWNGMVMRDKFRRTIYEPAPLYEIDPETREEVPVLDDEGNQVYQGMRPVYNPDYDPSKPYISRMDRPEWAAIGMLGVLAVREDGTCEVNGYCTVNKDGIATKANYGDKNSYRVIKRNDEDVIEIVFK